MTYNDKYTHIYIVHRVCLARYIIFFYVDWYQVWSIVVGSTVWPMDCHPPRHATWMQVAETWHPLVQRRRDFKGTRKTKGNLDVYCKTYEARFDFGVKAFFRSNQKRLSFLHICIKNWNYAKMFCNYGISCFTFFFGDTRLLYFLRYLRMIQWPWELQPKFVNYLEKHSWLMTKSWRRFTMHIHLNILFTLIDGLPFSDWRKSRAPPAKGKNTCPRIRKVWTDLEVVEPEFAPICVYIPQTNPNIIY